MKEYDAVDAMFLKPFKFKYGGMKLTARPMAPNEVIDQKSLMCLRDSAFDRPFPKRNWLASGCVGDFVSEHPDRDYILVLSPFFKGESQ